MSPSRVKIVERAGDEQIGVGIEIIAELVALMPQIAFDLELNVLGRITVIGLALNQVSELATELGIHDVVTQIGDVTDHACDTQTTTWKRAIAQIVAVMEIGVGHNGAASDFVKGNVLGCEIGCTGNDHSMLHACWVLQRPAQSLHTAQAASHHGCELINAPCVEQTGLRMNPVFNRDNRKVGPPGLAR